METAAADADSRIFVVLRINCKDGLLAMSSRLGAN
jgi:hypothetical protein